jgi:glycerol-3-phosphate dehydrogenase (NAD(P)+)
MKIGVLGCGVYALALSKIFKKNNNELIMWSKFPEETKTLKERYHNIKFTNNLADITNMDLVVIAIPSSFIIDTLNNFKNYYTKEDILIASKGILEDTSFISEVVSRLLNTSRVSVISGPTFAIDIDINTPLGLSLGCIEKESVNIIKKALETDYFKLELVNDINGIEFCGSIKNVIAIGSGIIEGLGYPESTRYKYLTNVIKDLSEVITLTGGNQETINSYSGIGDLFLTSTSQKSRNYSFGIVIGRKENYQEYLNNNTVEGYYTLKSLHNLLKRKNINMNLIDILYEIIYNGKNLNSFLEYLKQ